MLLFIDIAHKNPYANRPRIQHLCLISKKNDSRMEESTFKN